MSQKENGDGQDDIKQLRQVIEQKEELNQGLLERLKRQELQIKTLLAQGTTYRVPYEFYKEFLAGDSLAVKLSKEALMRKDAIWLSSNLIISPWNPLQMSEVAVQAQLVQEEDLGTALTSNVGRLTEDLEKFSLMIEEMRQLEHKDQAVQPMQGDKEAKLKRYINMLETDMFKLKEQGKQLQDQRTVLLSKVNSLQQKESQYNSRIKDLQLLQSRFLECNPAQQPPKKKHKRILLNY